MSKRLQVILADEEWDSLRAVARRQGMTVSAVVRRELRAACDREPAGDLAAKLAAIRRGAAHEFPTADIDQMLAEIEAGYTAATAA